MMNMFSKSIFILLISANAFSAKFNNENLEKAYASLSTNFDYERHADVYMQEYHSDVWSKYSDDEFELDSKRTEIIELMKEKYATFDKNSVYTINTSFEFGKYNFKKQFFPLTALQSGNFYSKRSYLSRPYPYDFKVYFKNTDIISPKILMDKMLAKEFVASKKSSGGYINRDIPVEIKFKIVSTGEEKGDLIAEIVKATLYTEESRAEVIVQYGQKTSLK